ncbi:hypothetical protein EMGBS15_10090 [Filimonas sp.]|nr:hypothetical protein EMGBS15_10090 [Filimonas sp.]
MTQGLSVYFAAQGWCHDLTKKIIRYEFKNDMDGLLLAADISLSFCTG